MTTDDPKNLSEELAALLLEAEQNGLSKAEIATVLRDKAEELDPDEVADDDDDDDDDEEDFGESKAGKEPA